MLKGKNLINGHWVSSEHSVSSESLRNVMFYQATIEQARQACKCAQMSFRLYSKRTRKERACFLRAIAHNINELGDEITEISMEETGLPEARMIGERARTVGQLNFFADLIEDTNYLGIRKDEALPDRTPLPRPDIRLMHKAIGPVVIFGASNFPLAFSTAGGDTASALAAGCPVIVKGHEAHPGTGELVAQAMYKAINDLDMPQAMFQFLQGDGRIIGQTLVQNDSIKAVGFTGSLIAGRALYDLCHSREKPIPFYGELGSINPVFCLPNAIKLRNEEIAKNWLTSLTMGAGQFCTNPGIMVMLADKESEKLEQACIKEIGNISEQKMLTDKIYQSYIDGIEEFKSIAREIIPFKVSDKRRYAFPALFKVSAKEWIANIKLRHEVFGAVGLIVYCDTVEEIKQLAEHMEGQLTCTLQMADSDVDLAQDLLFILEEKAGRILCNGFPTGVEVCSAMMHGGPYPASTDVRSTSVGTLAILRWLRPISYQNFPSALLPKEIQHH